MFSIGQAKVSNGPAKPCAFGPKEKKTLKKVKKILRFFDQNLYRKWTFAQSFTKYFLEFCILSESIYPWKITSDFYNNFSDFVGGGRSKCSYILATLMVWKMVLFWYPFINFNIYERFR